MTSQNDHHETSLCLKRTLQMKHGRQRQRQQQRRRQKRLKVDCATVDLLGSRSGATKGEQRVSTVSLQSVELDVFSENQQADDSNDSIYSIVQLPDEVVALTASFLNVGSLKQSRLVCRKFNRVLSKDQAGWQDATLRLWSRKVHVSEEARAMVKDSKQQAKSGSIAVKAYIKSCMDARLRHEICWEELVYQPEMGNTTVWDFRFKASSGSQWTSFDPYWTGESCRKMVFLPNGRVQQMVEEVVFDVDNPTKTETVAHFRLPFHDTTNPTGMEIKWRFVEEPLDFPKKSMGAYIRLTVDGRDIPTYAVHRDPTNSWGFILQNCWGVFASFELPRRKLPVSSTHTTSTPALDESSLTNQTSRLAKRELLEDSRLSVNTQWQWREALLYNFGCAILPDGPRAAEEFEHAWRRVQSLGMSSEEILRRYQSFQY